MDARSQNLNQGCRQYRFAVAVAALFFVPPLLVESADAQSLAIVATAADSPATVRLESDRAPFPPSRWRIVDDTSRRGCLVMWTADCFRHRTNSDAQADCKLALRIVNGNRAAGWRVDRATDSTNAAAGRTDASVMLSSRRQGAVEVEIAVEFQAERNRIPVAGTYVTTVTGTITGR